MKRIIFFLSISAAFIFIPFSTAAFAHGIVGPQAQHNHIGNAAGSLLHSATSSLTGISSNTNVDTTTTSQPPVQTESTDTVNNSSDGSSQLDSTSNDPSQNVAQTNGDTDQTTTSVPQCTTKPPVSTLSSGTPPTADNPVIPGGTVTFDTSCGSGVAQYVYSYEFRSVDLFSSTVHTETHFITIPRYVTITRFETHVTNESVPMKAVQNSNDNNSANSNNSPVSSATEKHSRPSDEVGASALLAGLGSLFMFGLRKRVISPFF